ncbi:unnamed protein product [Trichobilharzia regenti]|nr:unnamed protein product [Trichobilharzia regenti]
MTTSSALTVLRNVVPTNDFVLPQTVDLRSSYETDFLLHGQQQHDVVSAYLKRKRKSLYSLLASMREFSLPLRSKKGF